MSYKEYTLILILATLQFQKNMHLFSIKILFCIKCNWMFRATWISQEVINTFSNDIKSVSLVPSDGGKFEIWLDDKLIFLRH